MSKTAHLPFRLQPFASVGVQNIWGHKWGHFANLQAIMIINSIIYGEISNPTLSARLPFPDHRIYSQKPQKVCVSAIETLSEVLYMFHTISHRVWVRVWV